jgi:hypothetical protein
LSARISSLPVVVSANIADTDILPIVTGIASNTGVTKRVSITELRLKLGTTAPAGGRTVTSASTYLTNNAVFNVKDFGAFGDGVTDDTAAIGLAVTTLQAAGGGTLRFPKGTYNVAAVEGSALFTFTSLQGVTIEAPDATITDTHVYSGADFTNAVLFKFIATKQISIRAKTSSQIAVTTVAGTTHPRGLVAFQFTQGCKNITLDVEVVGGMMAVNPTKLFNDIDGYRSRQFRGRIVATGVYYPWAAQFSGDDSDLRIDSDTCGRSYYVYGTNNHKLHVRAKNQQATSLIWAFNGFGCRDIEVKFVDRDSDSNQTAAPRMQIGWGDSTAATHANLSFDIDVKNPSGSPWAQNIEFVKYSDGGTTPDSTGRGHVLDGFRLSGVSDMPAGVNHIGMGAGAFAASDICRNFRVKDFTGYGSTSAFSLGAASPIGQLSGRAMFENVKVGHNIYAVNGTNGEVVFVACEALNFSTATTDTDVHTLISCNASDGSVQSVLSSKTFVNTFVGGTKYKLSALEGTFTPTITFGGAAVGNVYSSQIGSYSRVGNRVYFSLLVALSTKGSSTGNMEISGLPYTSAASRYSSVTAVAPVTTGVTGSIVGFIDAGTSKIQMRGQNNGGDTVLTNANATNTTQFIISGHYDI